VTVLNEKGIPTEVAVTHLTPPRAIMGPLPAAELQQLIAASEMQAKYGEAVDPVSAHEILTERVNARQQQEAALEEKEEVKKTGNGRREKSAVEEVLSSPVAKEIGRQVVRGLFGMLFGTPKRRR
jgi:hypothetical protein